MNNQGFNLLEVLIVILVTSIVATVSLPFYRSFGLNQDLKGVARDIASDLRYAQQLSVTSQINHLVVFNISNSSYLIKNSQTQAVLKNTIIKTSVSLKSITDLPDNTVNFNATGAATSSGTIILTSINGKEATIEIKPSGYVKIQ